MASPPRPLGNEGLQSLIKRGVIGAGVIIAVIVFFSSCMTRVDAGHVGIRVKLAGSSRGVDDIPVVTGWVFVNAATEQLIMFPTSVQNVVWTKEAHEGNPIDESLTFSSQEGVNINCDIGLSFHIDPAHAPHLYLRFRKNDLIDLANGYVRNAVREAFNIEASQMPVQDIYGAAKGKLVLNVEKRIQDQLGKDGFMIDQLTINGALRLPDNVATAINRAMEQTQQAIQAENRVRQVKAEAEQAITQATGAAEAARAKAKGEADARLITAKAEAKANLIIRRSTSAAVLQYRALEKWNGHLPMMNGGGALPLLTFDASKIGKDDGAGDDKLLKQLLADDDDVKTTDDKAKDDAKREDANKRDEEQKKSPPPTLAPPAPPPAPAPKAP